MSIQDNKLLEEINDNILLHKSLINQKKNINVIINKIYKSLKGGGKILICGNGGSSSDASHLAAEFLVRLRPEINRIPLAAIPLTIDSATITACGNDYGFENLFLRNFKALAKKKDILLIISTSGNSKNILNVAKYANKKNQVIGFLGNKGGKAKKFCNTSVIVKSNNVARIQECHIFLGHFIIKEVENLIIKKNK